MRDPDWRSLVDELDRAGHQSPNLDRLRTRLLATNPEASHKSLEQELAAEMASSLGRAEEKVLVALVELERLQRQALSTGTTAALIETFNRQREVAVAAVLELVITREAVGLRHNAIIAELYPIPSRWDP